MKLAEFLQAAAVGVLVGGLLPAYAAENGWFAVVTWNVGHHGLYDTPALLRFMALTTALTASS